jgi:methylthioribose-1-phosphate isomerase
MRVNGKPFRTIWIDDSKQVQIIDQTRLPHEFITTSLNTVDDAAIAIADMLVRGAPLIGATAAYGMALAMNTRNGDDDLQDAYVTLLATRPTAVNLRWALDEMVKVLTPVKPKQRKKVAFEHARTICDDDARQCENIGNHGSKLIRDLHTQKQGTVNILTHCNAGWLATVDWGTALAPIYKAHEAGIPVHVWVDETRPRNQGASLTAWELQQQGIAHTVIVDNTGGHLMQHGMVDLCIVGSDRTTYTGDVCNKIGTYLKALAAKDNNIPFYVALPGTTIDWTLTDGVRDIPIEQRDSSEVSHIAGRNSDGKITTIQLTPENCSVANYAFDVTPARLVTALITERGVSTPDADGLFALYPEMKT